MKVHDMKTSPEISIVIDILRQHAEHLYHALTDVLGASQVFKHEPLTREQEQEFMLFVVSLLRIVASSSRKMTPFLPQVAIFGTETYAQLTIYLGDRTTSDLQKAIDVRVREYSDVFVDSGAPDSWNIYVALGRLAKITNASSKLRNRITSLDTQRFLRKQMVEFRDALDSIESRASDLHQQAREWLGQRMQAPDGDERGWGSFGNPEMGIHMSPRMQCWNPDTLDTPLRWVVLRIEDDFESEQQPTQTVNDQILEQPLADPGMSPKQRLGRLAKLLADDTITQDEHDAARQRILNQL
ncbi:MAG: hypothetical protein COW02_14950 [Comamonadaceae bacterium CG12_big_fil_rev_8_21_14_0_65_59_15]|nr:MAG: hypothetical protein COW02_14950 [Comamonadaceae bacterium CG12_big_fil_rev_8_21_14_0_65_59_15]